MPISRTSASSPRPEPQDGQREADLVVLVALVLERPVAGREDGGDGLLGRGLGDAPGDPHGQRLEAAAPGGGERRAAPASGRVTRIDAHVVDRGGQRTRPADEEPGRTGGDRLRQVLVAVGALAGAGRRTGCRAGPGASRRPRHGSDDPTIGPAVRRSAGRSRRRRTPRPACAAAAVAGRRSRRPVSHSRRSRCRLDGRLGQVEGRHRVGRDPPEELVRLDGERQVALRDHRAAWARGS